MNKKLRIDTDIANEDYEIKNLEQQLFAARSEEEEEEAFVEDAEEEEEEESTLGKGERRAGVFESDSLFAPPEFLPK